MAKKCIVGVESVNYTSKDGKPVSGVRIYVSTELQAPHIGISVKDEFITGGNISDYPLGEVQAILYEPTFKNNYRCVGVLYKPAKS